jgi:hydrogenase nickel incorporation protein HypA/HybF
MHEYSIAAALIGQAVELAEQNGLERIDMVEIEVGALQLVVPEALEAAFAAAGEGTPAAGAVLRQNETPARAECRACAKEYAVDIENYLCPHCGRAEAEIVAGRDIILKSLTGPIREKGGVT